MILALVKLSTICLTVHPYRYLLEINWKKDVMAFVRALACEVARAADNPNFKSQAGIDMIEIGLINRKFEVHHTSTVMYVLTNSDLPPGFHRL